MLGAALILTCLGTRMGPGPGNLGPRAARADGIMLVQAGAFWMGRDDGAPDEGPLHRVYPPRLLDRPPQGHERGVRAFLEARGLRSARGQRLLRRGRPGRAHPPAPTAASRADRRLRGPSGRGGLLVRRPRLLRSGRASGCPPRPSGRRPRAATTGAATPGATTPPGPEHAVFGRPTTRPTRRMAGPRAPGPTGVQDLLGNLREWTASESAPTPTARTTAARRPDPAPARVVRGASHDDPAGALRVTIRRFYSYDGPQRGLARGHHHVGFRCATSEDLGGY